MWQAGCGGCHPPPAAGVTRYRQGGRECAEGRMVGVGARGPAFPCVLPHFQRFVKA